MKVALEEGKVYDVKIEAKNARGEGIGKIEGFVVFIKNAKVRIGKNYKVIISKVYNTFAYGNLLNDNDFIIN